MATTTPLRDRPPAIDYMARDYASFRRALLDLASARLPEWTDRTEGDFGVALVELMSYGWDILSYYMDRMANECFPATAQERRNVIEHLRLIGYELAGPAPASALLSLIVGNGVNTVIEVRNGDRFATPTTKDRGSVTFEYTGDKPLLIDCAALVADSASRDDGSPLSGFKEAAAVIPVRQGRTIRAEVLGVSDGSPNLQFRLAQPSVLIDTIQLTVDTGQPAGPWRLRKSLVASRRAFSEQELALLEMSERIGSTLAFSREPDEDFATQTDENGIAAVLFGDNQYGKIPPAGAQISVSYRTGGGSNGNVGTGQIRVVSNAPQISLLGGRVVNRKPSSGGADAEPEQRAVQLAPLLFRSMNRAVTAEDIEAHARVFPGVGKARAEPSNWNTVKLFIAPAGEGEDPSDILKRDLHAYFEDRRMLTVDVQVEKPDYVDLEIALQFAIQPLFDRQSVIANVEAAVRGLYAFERADFRQTLYLSKVYEAVESLAGVDNVFVSIFRRRTDTGSLAQDGRIVLGENQIPVLRRNGLTLTPLETIS